MAANRIVFTRHAEAMLAERKIERDWAEHTIREPHEIETDAERGTVRVYRPIPEHDGRILRVVYSLSGDEIRVVTAFFDRSRRL